MLSLKKYCRENKLAIGVFLIFAIVNSAAAFLLPVSVGEFFRIVFQSDGSKGKLLHLLGIHLDRLPSFFLFFIVLVLVRALAEYLEKAASGRLGESWVRGLRESVFQAQISWTAERFRGKFFGGYLLRYSNDMKSVQNLLARGWLGASRDLVFLLMGFSVLFIISRPLAVLYAGMFLSVVFVFYLFSRLQRPLIKQSRDKRSSLLSFVTRSFQEHRKIREQDKQEKVIEKFRDRSEQLYESNMRNTGFESLFQALLPLFQYVMIGGVLVAMARSGVFSMHASDALVFVLIMLQMNGALKRFLKIMPAINKGRISLGKIQDILSAENGRDMRDMAGDDENRAK